jgi:hypothetical protein
MVGKNKQEGLSTDFNVAETDRHIIVKVYSAR